MNMKSNMSGPTRLVTYLAKKHKDVYVAVGQGNGLVYYRHSVEALIDAILRAGELPPATKTLLVERNRARDFSWASTAKALDRLYSRLPGRAGRLAA